MRTLYFRKTNRVDGKEVIRLVENDSKEIDLRICSNKKAYEVLKRLPNNKKKPTVIGYVKAFKNEDKPTKIKENKVVYMIDNEVAVREKKLPFEKVIGYIKVDEETYDSEMYIAVVQNRFLIIPIILLMILLISVLCLKSCTITEPVVEDNKPKQEITFKDGDKGSGELDTEKTEFGEQQTFRMKLNCTPTVENNEMNIRIESPAEENGNYGFVVKVYLIQKIDGEEVIEDFSEEPLQVYESPIIYGNENIEKCQLDTEVEHGNYIARAMYDIYDLDKNFIGQTACRLDIISK